MATTNPSPVRFYPLGLALLLVSAAPAAGYGFNGYVWPGSHLRVPFYISTSLQGNVPYGGTFEEGIEPAVRRPVGNRAGECPNIVGPAPPCPAGADFVR